MSIPLAPKVQGPLSEWSSSIGVEGCVPGATIRVRSSARPGDGLVAQGLASSGEARLALAPGVALNAKDRLTAAQSAGGQESLPVSDMLAVWVAPAPKTTSDLPNPAIGTHLWEFGSGVQVIGVLSGADVRISSPAGLLGRVTAEQGPARVLLSLQLPPAGTKVVAEERAPAGFSMAGSPLQTTGVVNALPVATGSAFPAPTNPQQPGPEGCDTALLVGGVVDGSIVTLTTTRDGARETRVFDLDQLWWVLNRPVDTDGEKYLITQGMPESARIESPVLEVDAGPATDPTPPVFAAPCAGTEHIAVGGLQRGAALTLQIGDDVYDAGEVGSASTTADLRVPPIAAGASVTITQQRCGRTASATATATDAVAVGDPALPDTPIECTYRLRVTSATPGALLEVRAIRRGPGDPPVRKLTGQVPVTDPVMQLDIAPALSALDDIWVAQLTCGGPWSEGPRHSVQPIPLLEPPRLLFPPIIGERQVRVAALPGAVVEVFRWVDGAVHGFLGSGAVTDPDSDTVHIYRPFLASEQVVLLQRFCSHFSALGPASDAAVPGQRRFALPVGEERSFPSEGGHDVRLSAVGVPAVTMTCRVDGSWSCTARAVNSQPGGTATFLLSFTAKDDQGVVFSKSLEGAVLPPNSGYFDENNQPLPPYRHITWPWKPQHPPLEPSFGDYATWQRMLGADGIFQLTFATWANSPLTPELAEDQIPAPGGQ